MRHTPAEVIAAWIRNGGNRHKAIEAAAVSFAESGHDDDASSWCCHGVWALHQDHTPIACARDLDCATKRAIELSKNGTDWSPWDVHRDASGRTGFGESHAAIRNFDRALAKFKRQFGGDSGQFASLFPGPTVPGTSIPDPGDLFDSGGLGEKLGDVGIPGVSQLANATGRIANFFGDLGKLILDEEGWKRIGLVVGGGVVALIGLNSVLKQGYKVDPAGTVKKAGKTAAVAAATKGKA